MINSLLMLFGFFIVTILNFIRHNILKIYPFVETSNLNRKNCLTSNLNCLSFVGCLRLAGVEHLERFVDLKVDGGRMIKIPKNFRLHTNISHLPELLIDLLQRLIAA